MSIAIQERAILQSLRRIPQVRWGEFLKFLDELHAAETPIRTGADLLQSGLVGAWADRDDLGDGREFARRLRHEAERRPIAGLADTPSDWRS